MDPPFPPNPSTPRALDPRSSTPPAPRPRCPRPRCPGPRANGNALLLIDVKCIKATRGASANPEPHLDTKPVGEVDTKPIKVPTLVSTLAD